MPKLTLSVNKEEENKNEIKNSGKLSVTQKTTIQNEIGPPDSTKLTVSGGQNIKPISANSIDEISAWLISIIGEKAFENVKNNEYLKLAYTENEELTIQQWLQKAMKTLFSLEQIKEIGDHILSNQNSFGKLQEQANLVEQEKKNFEEKMVKINARFERLKEEVEEAESEKHRIEKEMQTALPLEKLVNVFFKDKDEDTQYLKSIRNLLHEAIERPDKHTGTFIMQFAKGWTILNTSAKNLKGEEKDDMETLHKATIELLQEISGCHISERRPLLEIIAKILSENFKEYEFISPEQTLQIDPAIHNAEGLGSASIKEGRSFAVIRKRSRQAVKYADITI